MVWRGEGLVVWEIKKIDPEHTYRKCFALFPKRIGDYRVWLSPYYKTWDYTNITYGYIPHWFVFEEDVIKYVENKKARHEIDD